MIHQKLHKLIGLATVLLMGGKASAQLTINGAQFTIQSGATVTVQGDVTSNVDILGTGLLLLKGSTNQNVNMGGFNIPNLELDNTSNATLTGNASVSGDFKFTNGFMQLGTNNLAMGSAATITNAANTKFVVTNGTGRLIKAALGVTAFNYPVGNSTTTYNPLSISNAGTSDSIGVRCLASAYTNGLTGAAFTKEVVDASWDISEAVAGGSNLTLTSTWYATDELTGFNRTKAGISYYVTSPAANVGWDLLNSQTSAASGSNPYSFTRSGVSTLGTFAVGTRPVLSPLLVSPKIFLQGPYNGTNMNDGLRTVSVASGGTTDATHGVIPTQEPYTAISGFTHSGSGGGETISTGVFGVFSVSNPTDIVDWVFAQLHDGGTGTVVSTRSALLQRSGNVVETDGVSPLNFAGNAAANYYISIRHRNHLGVRSANNMALAKATTTPYDFTTAQTQAYPGVGLTNTPMAVLSGGFGLWGGNANSNTNVKYSGSANDENYLLNTTLGGNKVLILNGVYNTADMNMNGNVKYSGSANDESVLLNTVLGGIKTTIITQPTF